MDFDLTAEQKAFRRVVREFADEVVAPAAEAHDREETLPLEIVEQMAELGLFGLPFPRRVGGSDAGTLTAASRSRSWDAPTSRSRSRCRRRGPRRQHDGPVRHRRAEGALAPAARAGDDPGRRSRSPSRAAAPTPPRCRTTARLENGQWVAGRHEGVHHELRLADHHVHIVAAVDRTRARGRGASTDHRARRHGRGSRQAPPYRKMGWHASDTHELSFDGCRVPQEHLLGERGRGFSQALAVAGRGPHRRRRASDGPRPGLPRPEPRLRVRARGVRHADRRAPGDPVQDRRHARARSRPRVCRPTAPRGCRMRARPTSLRRRSRSSSRARPRWSTRARPCRSTAGYGFIEDFPGRALLPRREGPGDRRRHQRDPPASDRARPRRPARGLTQPCPRERMPCSATTASASAPRRSGARPGRMGWRYFCEIQTAEPAPHGETSTSSSTPTAASLRLRIDTGEHDILLEPRGDALGRLPRPRPVESRVGTPDALSTT